MVVRVTSHVFATECARDCWLLTREHGTREHPVANCAVMAVWRGAWFGCGYSWNDEGGQELCVARLARGRDIAASEACECSAALALEPANACHFGEG